MTQPVEHPPSADTSGREEVAWFRRIVLAESLDDFLADFRDYADKHWGADIIGIQLVDHQRRLMCSLRIHGARLEQNDNARLHRDFALAPGVSSSAWVAVRQRPLHAQLTDSTLATLSELDRDAVTLLSLRSVFLVPVVHAGRTIAVVQFGSTYSVRAIPALVRQRVLTLVSGMQAPIQRLLNLSELESSNREQQHLIDLARQINRSIDLPDLMQLLDEELEREGLFQSWVLALPEPGTQRLVCQHVHFHGELNAVQSTYQGSHNLMLDHSEIEKLVARGKPWIIEHTELHRHSHNVKSCFQRWGLRSLASIPLFRDQQFAGVLFGFNHDSPVNRLRLHVLEQRMPLFLDQIGNAQRIHEMLRQEEEIATANAQQQRLMNFINRVGVLTSNSNIHALLCSALLDWLPFDLAGIVIREGKQLTIKHLQVSDTRFEAVRDAWEEYYGQNPYTLDERDGATPYVYLTNERLYFPDLMPVRHLPMSQKDRQALELMGTPRGFLFLPIRREGEAIGVTWLFSIEKPVTLSEAQLSITASLCDVIGNAIRNAELYSTVERQKREIEQTLRALKSTQADLRRAEMERIAALERSKEIAEASARAKGVFIANTSHEIRTPLTAIIGFAETLLQGKDDQPEVARAAEIILRNGRHLLALLNDILDLSKIESGRLPLEQLNYSPLELFAELDSNVRVLASDKGLDFRLRYSFPLPARVVGDPTRTRQVLLNLLNNAVKFTEQGHIGMEVEYLPKSCELRVLITDSGIGMEPEQLEHIFEPFTQADSSTSRRYGGPGLGLSIAKQLTERLGGRLTVDSTPGEGTCFQVTLPVNLGADQLELLQGLADFSRPIKPGYQEHVPLLRGVVLIADDSDDTRALVQLQVERTGARTVLARNGREAVDMMEKEPVDLVLMDVQMPVMNGVDAMRTIRSRGYDQPMLAMTAHVMDRDRVRIREQGFDGFLGKPLDNRVFFATLARYLPPAIAADQATEDAPAPLPASSPNQRLEELRKRFLAHLPDALAELEAAWQASDAPQTAAESHKLAGAAGCFGHERLARLAMTLEQACRRDGPEGERHAAWQALQQACQETLRQAQDPAAS
ncbi:MAG: response regulator [Ectothiorhodospiraceae bacterium]|nr:response regulator [Ectothiorhodospiraceae bacterium]